MGADIINNADYVIDINNESSITINAKYKDSDIFGKQEDLGANVAYVKTLELLDSYKVALVAETGGEHYAIKAYALNQDYTLGLKKVGTITLNK